jgi:hypothetical protein
MQIKRFVSADRKLWIQKMEFKKGDGKITKDEGIFQ